MHIVQISAKMSSVCSIVVVTSLPCSTHYHHMTAEASQCLLVFSSFGQPFLLQVDLPRVLEYSRVLDSKKYSSNVLVLEYSFNSASGRKFQFPVPVFQINKQLLEVYANLAPSPSSCDLRLASCELCNLIH